MRRRPLKLERWEYLDPLSVLVRRQEREESGARHRQEQQREDNRRAELIKSTVTRGDN